MPRFLLPVLASIFGLSTLPVAAHVSERALVLLLPTDFYMLVGVIAVLVTVFLTVLVPPRIFQSLYPRDLPLPDPARGNRVATLTSLISATGFAGLIYLGLYGPRDPLENLLTLAVFSVWWIVLPFVQAAFGDVWAYLNPWSGPVRLVFGARARWVLPQSLGYWPAVATYFAASVYTLTDLAPDDPERLAKVVTGYWVFTFVMCGLFGRDWLRRGEGLSVFLTLLADLAPLRWRPFSTVFPGQTLLGRTSTGFSLAVFCIAALAAGSFDGLNETFWWMGQIGINPLEFPGRSAVIWPNRLGLTLAILALSGVFALAVLVGLALIGQARAFHRLLGPLALTLLPIALGYHAAHYLTTALVNLQYVPLALNDPLDVGAQVLGFQDYYVTTSFFNQQHTVQRIWLSQASAIVLAHMLAVILSHVIALRQFDSHRRAVVSQLPVSLFMIGYTLFGLWLLASPVAL